MGSTGSRRWRTRPRLHRRYPPQRLAQRRQWPHPHPPRDEPAPAGAASAEDVGSAVLTREISLRPSAAERRCLRAMFGKSVAERARPVRKNQELVFLAGSHRLFETKKEFEFELLFRVSRRSRRRWRPLSQPRRRRLRVERIKRAACRACGRACRRRGLGRARLATPCRPCRRRRLACDSSACHLPPPE